MKILLVTPVNPKLKQKNPLPDWQPQNHWYLALKALKHKVKTFSLTDFPNIKLIKTIQLKKIIKQYKPDEIFFSAGADRIYPFKNTVFFSAVPASVLSLNERNIGLQAKLILTNDQLHADQWRKLAAKKVICLPISAIDSQFFNPGKNIKKTIDVSFIGTLFPQRQKELIKLTQYIPQLKIWGRLEQEVKLFPELTSFYQGEAWGNKVTKIYQQSKIALNLVPQHMVSSGNLRTFEIPATKTLMLTDKINSYWYQPDKHIAVFKNPQQAGEKVKYFLSHPQALKQIALAGYQQTIKNHTYKHRFQAIFKLLK